MKTFELQSFEQRVVFGKDHLSTLLPLVQDLGVTRAMVLSTPGRSTGVAAIAEALGERHFATFDDAVVHTPVEVTDRALNYLGDADGFVSLGGGSAVGLGKALALRTGLPHIAIPTTYSGSEISPILGQTRDGKKTTIRDKRVVPQAVIYDVSLTLSLPLDLTVSSGLNAMAHAFEALYAPDRSPETDRIAVEAIAGFAGALPILVDAPRDWDARATVLYAAYLSGRVLAARTMGLHHKLAHVLGGLYDLPHAPMHAALLPHVIRFNEVAAKEQLGLAADALGHESAAEGLEALALRLNVARSLAILGMPLDGASAAAEQVMQNPAPNPRAYGAADIVKLLEGALRS
ncbi:maleylacetate reductase [Devosia sp.]|uniref:maleylacetate reductase n=1 Tax=Devosia sp. TaxID=1871048 RepID=UPI001AFCFD73|nr:maleylacetate reductase [Devosia sp.]MBO9589746.1 maleylacetate reductase [Devosia sp.]